MGAVHRRDLGTVHAAGDGGLLMWRRKRKLADLDAELRAHVEMETRDRVARGEIPADAARRARAHLGDTTTIREITGDIIGGAWIEQVFAEFRHAVRGLLRSPAFTIAATLTLLIGIGGAAATFAIVRSVLLEPMPYPQSGRLVDVWQDVQWPSARRLPQTPATYFTYQRLAHTVENIAAFRVGSANVHSGALIGEAERVPTAWFTANMLATLRVQPMLGRSFTDAEDVPDAPGVAIVSESFWRTRLGGRRDVLGATIYANDVKRVIVGVMPDRFRFPAANIQIWFPARIDRNAQYSGDFTFWSVARLKPGVSPAQAQREFGSLNSRLSEEFPNLEPGMTTDAWVATARPMPAVIPMRDDVTSGIANTLWMLAVAAALVLVVTCANVTNLLLIRADARQLQVAVREALGASRLRVVAHFVAESLVLAGVAAILGLIAAAGAVHAVASSRTLEIPRVTEIDIDAVTIGFTMLLAVLIALGGGIVSAARSRGQHLFTVVRGGPATTSTRAQHRVRHIIAAVQIALALVALNGSALLLRTFQRLRSEQPGFSATNVTTAWTLLSYAGYPHDSGVVEFDSRVVDRISRLPGVAAAGMTSRLPLGGGDGEVSSIYLEGSDAISRQSAQVYMADSGYFAALRIPLVAGQFFPEHGARETDVIISRGLAGLLWRGQATVNALGKRFRTSRESPVYTVVGIVGDVKDRTLDQPALPTIYLPQVAPANYVTGHRPRHSMAIVVRTNLPTSIAPEIRRIVREANPTVPIFAVSSMDGVMRESMMRLSVTLTLMGAAAIVTLILGSIGLYGVMAYVIALRSRELSLRVVLGADPKRLVRTLAAQGLSVAAFGIAGGIVLFELGAQFLHAFLFGIASRDLATLTTTIVTVMSIAAIASWLPARRAANADPRIVLR